MLAQDGVRSVLRGIDLSTLETPAAVRIDGDRWVLDQELRDPLDVGLLITRVGSFAPVVADGLPVEADVREQLEALGYLD